MGEQVSHTPFSPFLVIIASGVTSVDILNVGRRGQSQASFGGYCAWWGVLEPRGMVSVVVGWCSPYYPLTQNPN